MKMKHMVISERTVKV